jgi:hypothetical protein
MGDRGVGAFTLSVDPSAAASLSTGIAALGEVGWSVDLLHAAVNTKPHTIALNQNVCVIFKTLPRPRLQIVDEGC